MGVGQWFDKAQALANKTTSLIQAGAVGEQSTGTDACEAQDREHRALVQVRLAVMGVECEKLCKKMGIYPNCQCPGFEGSPATSFDYRACFVKYCQDRSALEFSCPTDAFVTCVKQATQVSVLQWPALLQWFDKAQALANKTTSLIQAGAVGEQSTGTDACKAQDREHRALVQGRSASRAP